METRFLFTKAVYEPSPFGVKFAAAATSLPGTLMYIDLLRAPPV